jgi:hypothetical protein
MPVEGVSTIERVVDVSLEGWRHIGRRRRRMHRVATLLLATLLLAAVLDGLDIVDAYGPDEDRVTASGGGFTLTVEHPSVTRPALASVLRLEVRRPGGFDEPVQVAVSRSYLESFDLNGVLPAAASETALGRWIIWEFDPPPGDELVITYEARLEPGLQSGRDGEAAILVDDEPVARVRFHTAVRP